MQKAVMNVNEKLAIKSFFNRLVENLRKPEINPQEQEQLVNELIEILESAKASSAQIKQEQIEERVEKSIKDLATKDFVRAEIAQARVLLETKIAESKTDTIKWMITTAIGMVGALTIIIKFFLLPQ